MVVLFHVSSSFITINNAVEVILIRSFAKSVLANEITSFFQFEKNGKEAGRNSICWNDSLDLSIWIKKKGQVPPWCMKLKKKCNNNRVQYFVYCSGLQIGSTVPYSNHCGNHKSKALSREGPTKYDVFILYNAIACFKFFRRALTSVQIHNFLSSMKAYQVSFFVVDAFLFLNKALSRLWSRGNQIIIFSSKVANLEVLR